MTFKTLSVIGKATAHALQDAIGSNDVVAFAAQTAGGLAVEALAALCLLGVYAASRAVRAARTAR